MSTVFWREKRSSLPGAPEGVEHLESCCTPSTAGSHCVGYVVTTFSPEEVGNANASRGQADGHGARRHYSELESHVLAGGAAAALFQIIVARQEC